MAEGGSFWDDDLSQNIDAYAKQAETGPGGELESAEDEVVSYARINAPWRDRTGEARDGLQAEAVDEPGVFYLVLYHTAPHGYWLELIQSGRFAIIMPTLQALAPGIARRAGGTIFDIRGG